MDSKLTPAGKLGFAFLLIIVSMIVGYVIGDETVSDPYLSLGTTSPILSEDGTFLSWTELQTTADLAPGDTISVQFRKKGDLIWQDSNALPTWFNMPFSESSYTVEVRIVVRNDSTGNSRASDSREFTVMNRSDAIEWWNERNPNHPVDGTGNPANT